MDTHIRALIESKLALRRDHLEELERQQARYTRDLDDTRKLITALKAEIAAYETALA